MTCREVEEQDIIERYFLGQLTDLQRDEFEQHYFECDVCSSQLQTEYAIQEGLRHHLPPGGREHGAWIRQKWFWMPAFALLASVALLLATGIWWHARKLRSQLAASQIPITKPAAEPDRGPTTSGPNLEELARVQPPPYSAILLRGAEDAAQTDSDNAMLHYLKGDYTGAIPGLLAAAKASPRTARYPFYLGAFI